jgi:hypothetical protein
VVNISREDLELLKETLCLIDGRPLEVNRSPEGVGSPSAPTPSYIEKVKTTEPPQNENKKVEPIDKLRQLRSLSEKSLDAALSLEGIP